ncbi:MAG: FG-GAP-like repeat-containing protein, partial [Blastocatellia bacterium]
ETTAGSLTVSVQSAPAGITLTGISNNNGTISATVSAGCAAAIGAGTVTLQVTDGSGLGATAGLTLNVIANTPPAQGTYAPTTLTAGDNRVVTPAAAPADNGAIASLTAQTDAAFTGTLSVNSATGAVTINNAGPAGSYTINVTATDNCGASSTAPLRLSVGITANCGVDGFEPAREFSLNATGPSDMIAADFNRDGRNDLVTANLNSGAVTLLTSNGPTGSGFNPPVQVAAGNSPYALAAGDFNRDTRIDLAVVNSPTTEPGSVSILLATATGGFAAPVSYPVGDEPTDIVTADFNLDGVTDLAVTNTSSDTVSVLYGNGNGTFQPALTLAADVETMALTVGLFNNDNRPDIAAINFSTRSVSVFLGKASGGFDAAVNYNTGVQPQDIVAGDFNNDTFIDLAVANFAANTVSILDGTGTGGFAARRTFASGSAPVALDVADFNGDGKLDLLAANSNAQRASILFGNGNGGFAAPTGLSTGQDPVWVIAADLNRDNRPDVAAVSDLNNKIVVLLNSCGTLIMPVITAVSPPSIPVGSPSFIVTVTGADFREDYRVLWNGLPRQTTFVSATELRVTLPSTDAVSPGTARISVIGASFGASASNELNFTIVNPVPTPVIASLSPTGAFQDSEALSVTINGTGFTSASQVRWNGQDRPTSFSSDTRLSFIVNANDLVNAGAASVTVANAADRISNAATFTINPRADLALQMSVAPRVATPGATITFTMTVTNKGRGAAENVRLFDELPEPLTPFRCTAPAGICDIAGKMVMFSLARLEPGQNIVITLDAVANCLNNTPATTGISNAATVSTTTPEPDFGENFAFVSLALAPAQMRVSLATSGVEFAAVNPARENNPNAPSRLFTIENTGCAPMTVRFDIRRAGGDTTNGKITSADDSVTFPIRLADPGQPEILLNDGSFRSLIGFFGGQKRTFRLVFDPKVPAPAGRSTALAAHQAIPDVINSLLTITPTTLVDGIPFTTTVVARTGTQARLINPLAPRLAPLVALKRSGVDEFTVECSLHDPNLDTYLLRYQFLDGSGNPVLQPPDVELDFSSLSLVRGQSFSVIKRFTGARNQPGVQRVKVVLFDRESSESAVSTLIDSGAGRVVNASAASFSRTLQAPESIVAAFGTNLATGSASATTLPLPRQLGGTRVFVTDSNFVEREAQLFFVSPGQVNYLLPGGTASGEATVVVAAAGDMLSTSTIQVSDVAPGFFSANASGAGIVSGLALRVRGKQQTYESVASWDGTKYVARALDLGPASEELHLILFGTGLRFHRGMAGLSGTIGNVPVDVTWAGAQGGYAGLDQVNIKLPRALIGQGETDIVLRVDGQITNVVRIAIK